MKILILDNYDSFTFNLYQAVGEILERRHKKFQLDVLRNDEIPYADIKKRAYDRVIISPGPGDPSDSAYFGVCKDVLIDLGKKVPVLGVCLGMQGIAHYYGGRIIRARLPMHGKTSIIAHTGNGIFQNVPQEVEVMRYHSLIPDPEKIPDVLEVIATVKNDTTEIMSLRHRKYPIVGVQFHPESFATEGGKIILRNFLFPPLRHSGEQSESRISLVNKNRLDPETNSG